MAIRDVVRALGIEVRAGLHTGECEVRGDDIGGIESVHIGARVSALAGPNDVLVSSTLRDLVIGSGLEFEDRGAHQLKGAAGEVICSPSPASARRASLLARRGNRVGQLRRPRLVGVGGRMNSVFNPLASGRPPRRRAAADRRIRHRAQTPPRSARRRRPRAVRHGRPDVSSDPRATRNHSFCARTTTRAPLAVAAVQNRH